MKNRHVPSSLLLTTLLLWLALLTTAQAATLSSSVDRQQIGEDETLNLTISVDDSSISGTPDLAGLDSNFQIVRSSSNSNTTIINGQATSSKEWHYTLLPRHTGKLLIPSFKLGSLFSDAIEVDVTPNATDNNGNAGNDGAAHGDLFLEQKLDKNEAYVQERITLTLRIYTAIRIARPQIPDPVLPDVMVEKLGEAEYESRQNGRNYTVLEYRYGLFANKSGKIVLPKQRYEISQIIGNSGLFDFPGFDTQAAQSRFLSTPEAVLTIKPQPDNNPAPYWLASEDLRISDNWPTQQTAEVGTPLTRTIEVKAVGNLASQIPPLPSLDIAGLKSYPENPVLDNAQVNGNFLATRKENIAIVPVQPGNYTLPAITIHWWDTKNHQFRTSTLPERTLTVHDNATTPAPSAATPPAAASSTVPTANPSLDTGVVNPPLKTTAAATVPFYLNGYLWMGVAAGLLLLWIVTLVLLFRKNTSRAAVANPDSQSSSLKEALKQLKSACQKNDAKRARASLIAWAQQQWPQATIHTLADVKHCVNTPDFAKLADDLDSCLYRNNAVWNGKPLADFMQTAKFSGTPAKPDVKLPGLYS